MATTVKSTDLDFQNIKAGLKNYFKSKQEFADYDFEASGLNNVLDVLAYNTHINGLTANFALNEAFLNTAQLRSSVVSHAETLGYEVRSRTTASALVNLTVNLSGITPRPAQIQLPRGRTFTTSIDGVSYTFRTTETYFAKDNGSGLYQFITTAGSTDIPIFEGTEKTKNFLVGEADERQVFVIPDETIDTSTVSVIAYDTASSSNGTTYTPLKAAITIDKDTTIFAIREAPNGFYELNFGDGISFGKKPDVGNKVTVTYLSSVGPAANNGDTFTANADITIDGVDYTINVSTANESSGGAFKQSIESVRQLAPIAYAAQQRLVTALDYKGMILSNFTQVQDCNVWSGDQNIPIDYGAVYIALNYPTGTTQATKDLIESQIVSNFTDNLSVVSMTTKFVEPVDVYLELTTDFQFDPSKTGFTLTATENSIFTFIQNYFLRNLNTFSKTFRRSNLLTEIDAQDQSILSSRCDVKVQLRISPSIGVSENFTLAYPMKIKAPDDVVPVIQSNLFIYDGVSARIQNRLNSTRLEIIDLDDNVLLDNIGEYNSADGKVMIIGLDIDGFVGGQTELKISVIPDNPSVIAPLRNYILRLDVVESSTTATIDRQTTTLRVV